MKRMTTKGQSERAQALRARLEQLGPDTMTTAELLEVLGVGPGAPTLFELAQMDARRLAKQVGPEVATTVRAAVELGRRALQAPDVRPRLRTPRDAYRYLEPVLAARPKERFHVLCLTPQRVLVASVPVAEGTRDLCMVDPKEVFSAALAAGAGCLVLAHNHPSGDPTPSGHDVALTQNLVAAGQLLGLPVLDHMVLGAGRYVSMGERGLCEFGTPPNPVDNTIEDPKC